MIALDTETHLIAPYVKAPRLVCVSFSDGRLRHRLDSWAHEVLEACNTGTVGHNVSFDFAVLISEQPKLWPAVIRAYEADRVTDTMLREQLLDISAGTFSASKGYSLAAVAQRRLGISLDKETVRLRYEEMTNIPCTQWPAAFRDYAIKDAQVTLAIWEAQESQAHLLKDQYRQARAALWLQLASCWGMVTDQAYVQAKKAELQALQAKAGETLFREGILALEKRKGVMVPVKKRALVQDRLVRAYASQGKEPPKTPAGAVATDRETCETSGDPVLKTYSEFAQLGSLLGNSDNEDAQSGVEAFNKPIIQTWFKPIVASGRTSSSKPNVQNFARHHSIRECIIPRPGCLFVVADYKGFELATLAQVCLTLLGRSSLAEALNQGLDAHAEIAANILGRPYEWVMANKKDPHVDEARQTGKVVNFGCPGGLGPPRLVHYAKKNYNVILTEDRAKELKYQVWQKRWPEMRDYFELVGRVVEQRGCVEQLFSGRLRGGLGFCDGCNTLFQGLAADIAKDAGWTLMRFLYENNAGRIVNFVHDEFVAEVPIKLAKVVAKATEKIMVEKARPWLPGVKLGVDVSIKTRYSKGTKYDLDL